MKNIEIKQTMNKFLALILVLSFNTYSQKKNSIITYFVSTVASLK